MDWTHRCLIVPDALVAQARTLAESLAGPAGAGMWTTGLSSDGAEPATHWISVGLIDQSFADLLPLTIYDAEGNPTAFPGQASAIVDAAAQAGMTVTLTEVQALLDAALITEDEPHAGMERVGLKLVSDSQV